MYFFCFFLFLCFFHSKFQTFKILSLILHLTLMAENTNAEF